MAQHEEMADLVPGIVRYNVFLDARVDIRLNLKQAQTLGRLLGFDMPGAVAKHVTGEIPRGDMEDLFTLLKRSVSPVIETARKASVAIDKSQQHEIPASAGEGEK